MYFWDCTAKKCMRAHTTTSGWTEFRSQVPKVCNNCKEEEVKYTETFHYIALPNLVDRPGIEKAAKKPDQVYARFTTQKQAEDFYRRMAPELRAKYAVGTGDSGKREKRA